MPDHPSPPPTTLLLCRHGQSEWNAEGRAQGQSPEAGGLTEHGRREARRLGQRLQALNIAALYTSDLARAWETAQIVAAAIGLPAQLDHRWREMDLGAWQGLSSEQVSQRWPVAQIREEDLPRGETGETFAALSRRTSAAIDDLAAQYPGQTIAVVCHGGNVRAALLATEASSIDGPDPRRAPIPNTSVTGLQVDGAGLRAVMIADVSHLDGLAPDTGIANADE